MVTLDFLPNAKTIINQYLEDNTQELEAPVPSFLST